MKNLNSVRILMVGAGATGGYYGGRLTQAGRDLTFLVRGKRLQQLQTEGIRIRGPIGDADVPVKTVTAADLKDQPPFDVVMISVKAYSLDDAIRDIAPAVGPETLIIPMLNGMRHIDVLCERFGRERVLGGSVRIVADVDDEGVIHQTQDMDVFTYGELDGGTSPRVEALLPVLQVFGFEMLLSTNIVDALWQKWWLLATLGCICVVNGGAVGDVEAVPYGKETALAILQENVDISAANGYPSDESVTDSHRKLMTTPGSTFTSSMYRDMTRGQPVEADHILGDLLARAKGVQAPLLKAAYVRLKIYEGRR